MAWQHSTLHEFQTTAGRQQPCSAVSPGWQKCNQPPTGSTLFEAMALGQQPKLDRDHVLLHDAASVSDADVEGLAASAALWGRLTQNAPDMLPHKVLACDLLCKAEIVLVKLLKPLMIKQKFPPCEHISHAVVLYRYAEMPPDRHTALGTCLTTLCKTVGISLEDLYQFEILAEWAQERNSCFHPLGHNQYQLDAGAVAAARVDITNAPEFEVVRACLLLLVRVLEGWQPLAQPPA